ncbi:MAG: RtcB family protein [Clostridia bacterium]|nr:RtcB family protein [Clostridia bacterium]
MIRIKGQYAEALCYARVVEDSALEQIKAMCDQPFTQGCQVRVMPDVHAGKGCTIGTTMTIRDKVVPNVVGVDIGCGMYSVRLNTREPDLARVDEAAHWIPSGFDTWEGRKEHFDLTQLKCYRELRDTRRMERSLGTLGGGNHFIEIDRDSAGECWLVIHSGSRSLGAQTAEYYQRRAIDLCEGKGELFRAREELIARYKAEGRRKEIQAALKKLEADWAAQSRPVRDVPDELCWLSGEDLDNYLHDVALCQAFARRNRELMAELLLERVGLRAEEAFHTVHNYIDTDEMILRKGAIAAHQGERVLIPINMRDGSILAVGRGNPEWNYSAPHGAGRVLSRSAAREQLSMAEYTEAMRGIYTTSVSEGTLDESPMAYKRLEDIIEPIRESVDVIDTLKPIYNFKAAG